MSVLTSDIFSPQAISCLVVSLHSIKRLVLIINLLPIGMVVVLSGYLVRHEFLLTLVYLELDSSKNLVVLQRQLQLQKKPKIYSESMDLLTLELLQLSSVKVEIYLVLVEQQSLQHLIHKKGRFYSPSLELSQRDILKTMLEKAYSSRFKQQLRNLYLTMLVQELYSVSTILRKQEYMIIIAVLLLNIQILIMVLSLIETILQSRRLEQQQLLFQQQDHLVRYR